MARIRSVHPGQWKDQDFVECSFGARLLALALRNEADDQGIFEWKPKQIKMNVFPADSVDVDALLAELVQFNIVKAYEVDGRRLGAIRNFRRYQRPKTPNAVHAMTDEIREYVALIATKTGNETLSAEAISEIEDDEEASISETLGKSPEQMEEEGDKMKDEGGKKKTSGAAPQPPPATMVPFIEIPTNRFEITGEQYPVYEPMIEEFQKLYPAVDIRSELRKMRGWSIGKPAKRKTKRGMGGFIHNWLSKQQDAPSPRETFNGGRNGGQQKPSQQSFAAGLSQSIQEGDREGGFFDGGGEIIDITPTGDSQGNRPKAA